MSKIEAFWQPATAKDVERVMAGETVEARFRDDEKAQWFVSELAGWTAGMIQWYSTDDDFWTQCQVYREPSWYANKPDPGPGYRLLEKFPDEPVAVGDEFYREGVWNLTCKESGSPHAGYWYRRRIEQVEPVESKPVLIRRRVVEIGDELKLPNGSVWVFNGEGFEVTQ
jgi:hypothetical protein